MKKLLQRLRPPLVLLVIGLFAGCATEETISVNPSRGTDELKSRFISLEELEKMPGVMEKLNSFTRRNSNKKLVSSDKYEFSVETEQVLLLEKGNYKSLTFPVYRSTPSDKLENLFLHPHMGGYLAFLMRADLSEMELRNLDDGVPTAGLISKLQFIPLDDFDMPGLDVAYIPTDNWTGNTYNYPGTVWKENGICYTWHNYAAAGEAVDFRPIECPGCCPEGTGEGSTGNTSTPGVTQQQYLAIVDMIGSQGGSGSSGPGSGGSGSGGVFTPGDGFYTPFNPVKPDEVDPLDPQNEDFYHPNPIIGVVSPNRLQLSICEELKIWMLSENVKNSFETLIGKTSDQNDEYGFLFKDNAQPAELTRPASTVQTLGAAVIVPSGGMIYGASHTHPDPTGPNKIIPMFSISDIAKLGEIASRYYNPAISKNYNKFVFTLTVKGGSEDASTSTYAIKIENWDQFKIFVELYYNSSIDGRKTFGRALNREYSKGQNNFSPETYLAILLKYLHSNNIKGIAIYKANSNFTRWDKKVYNPATNEVNSTPCPNP